MKSKITFGSRVTTCDCLLTGRVSMVWHKESHVPSPKSKVTDGSPTLDLKPWTLDPSLWPYFRVQFPPRSPFLDDWAVYRAHEVAMYTEQPTCPSWT